MSNDTSTGVKEQIDRAIERYTLPVFGWLGILTVFGWVGGIVPDGVVEFVLLFVSGVGALHGHHALAMGWYDSDNSNTDSRGENQQQEARNHE